MAGTQRCGKWEKTVNREALCMTAQALYNVFGIQMSLFQVWQSACLPALVVSGRALERFMKWWCILKQTNPPKEVIKDELGTATPPLHGRGPKGDSHGKGLRAKASTTHCFSFALNHTKGQPLSLCSHWQSSQVSRTPHMSQGLTPLGTHTHEEWSQAWTFLFLFQDGQARASSDLDTLPKKQ